jgi:drug/metabolite transporter (DMT)-like permease
MRSQKTPYPASVWFALVLVYLVWGSTYLGIRIAIETIPPFFMAGTRFLTAGVILYALTRLSGVPKPSPVHWKSAAVVGFFLILIGNCGVSWAEKKVPSGIAALLVGTVPLWMVLLEWAWKKGARPGWRVWAGIALGMAGIALLVLSRQGPQGLAVEPWSAVLLMGTSLAWAFGSLYARSALLPSSPLLATAMEMTTGGLMQIGTGFLLGEQRTFQPALLNTHSMEAWVYLTFIGSLVGYTSYVWVLKKATPDLASTYAFVNPVIAVFLGWLWVGEAITSAIFLGAGLIVAAVVLITLGSKRHT